MTNATNKKTGMTGPHLYAQIIEYPNGVLDAVSKRLRLKNDAALSRALGIAPPIISKIRHRKLSVGPSVLVRMLEITNLTVRDLYHLSMSADSAPEAPLRNRHRESST